MIPWLWVLVRMIELLCVMFLMIWISGIVWTTAMGSHIGGQGCGLSASL